MAKRVADGRGGHQQRRKRSAVGDVDAPAADVDFPSSSAGHKLVSSWAWGEISAGSVQEFAKSMVETFGDSASDVSSLSRLGAHGHSEQNCNRDLQQLFRGIDWIPEPVEVDCAVLRKGTAGRSSTRAPLSIFLPHDWFSSLAQADGMLDAVFGTESEIREFWSRVKADDPRLQDNPLKSQKKWRELVYPFVLHGDAGPHQKHDSMDVLSFKSALTDLSVNTSVLLLGAIPTACTSSTKTCKTLDVPFLGDTKDELGKWWAWSWNAVFEGRHPERDPFGKPFPAGSRREGLAGSLLDPVRKRRGVLWLALADCEHLSLKYGLPHHAATEPCMRCRANQTDAPWRDLSTNAKWRELCYTPDTVLTNHWVSTVLGTNPFTFVFDPMHCLELGPAGTAVATVFFDMCYNELSGTKPQKLNKLSEEIREIYDLLNIQQNRITHLEYTHFCADNAPHKIFPDLSHAAVKARQVRYLVPVAAELCRRYTGRDKYRKLRLKCLEALDSMYKIVDRNDLFLPTSEARLYKQQSHQFAVHFAALSHFCSDKDENKWPIRTKLHYSEHIAEEARFLSPKAQWCYSGESMVGSVTSLAQSCLSSNPPHKVPALVCTKYRVAKHLQFKAL